MTVSTHVLDATLGAPAAGVTVSLAFSGPGGWEAIETGVTDSDGRHLFEARAKPGVYRVVFGTGGYFAARGVASFYPEVIVTFTVVDGHYHVPLLLSPFAYSTYRGS
jgi:5-hydroxyisourate hydrolase